MERRACLVKCIGQLADVHLQLGERLLAFAGHSHLQVLELVLHAFQLPDLLVLAALEGGKTGEHGGEEEKREESGDEHDKAELAGVWELVFRGEAEHAHGAQVVSADLDLDLVVSGRARVEG